MKHRLTACALSLVLAAFPLTTAAQQPTYEEVEAKFAGTAYARWTIYDY